MLQEILSEIEAHLAWRASIGKPMAPSTFGRHAVNDGKLVDRLRNGKPINTDKIDAIRRLIANDRASLWENAA